MDAPANEIANGRKIIDFANASPRCSRSASIANARPMATPKIVTRMIHPSVLRIAVSMPGSVKRNRKLSNPTKSFALRVPEG